MSFIKKLNQIKAKEPINIYSMDVMVPTTILEFDLSAIIDNNELVGIMNQHRQEFPIGLNDYDGRTLHAWHSDWKTHLINPKFDPFIDKIKSCLKGHYSNLVLSDFWFNTYEDSGSAKRHRHGLTQISGVYFVECDESSSPLVLDNNYKNIEHITIQPKPGKLVVFPGYVYHSVTTDTSDKRTSIAFNFFIRYDSLTEEQVEERKKLCRGS